MKEGVHIQLVEAFLIDGLPVDVDFKLVKGEINFLVGANGAGKTSLLNFFKLRQKLFGKIKISFLDQERLSPLGNLSVKECLQILQEECLIDPERFVPGYYQDLLKERSLSYRAVRINF